MARSGTAPTKRQQAASTLSAELKALRDLREPTSRRLYRGPGEEEAKNRNDASCEAVVKQAETFIQEFNVDHPQIENMYFNSINWTKVRDDLQDQRKFYTSLYNRAGISSEITEVTGKNLATNPATLKALNELALADEGKPDTIRAAILANKQTFEGAGKLSKKPLLDVKVGDTTLLAFVNDNDCKVLYQAAVTKLAPLEKVISQRACVAFAQAAKKTDLKTLLALEKLTTEGAIRSFIADNRTLFDLETIDQDTLKSPLVISSATLTTLHKEAKKQIVAAITNTVSAAIRRLEDGDALGEIAEAKDNSALIKHWDKLGLSGWDFKTLDNFIAQPVLATFQTAAANHPKKSRPKATATPSEEKPKEEKALSRNELTNTVYAHIIELQKARNAYATLDPEFVSKTAADKETANATGYILFEGTEPESVVVTEAEKKKVDDICKDLAGLTTGYISKSNSIRISEKINTIKDSEDPTLKAIDSVNNVPQFYQVITTHQRFFEGSNLVSDEKTSHLILGEAEIKYVKEKAREKLQTLASAKISLGSEPKASAAATSETKMDIPPFTPTPSTTATTSTATTSTTVPETKAFTASATSERKTHTSTHSATATATATSTTTTSSEAKTAAPPRNINDDIKKVLPTIANEIDLSDAKEVKAIVRLVTYTRRDAETAHDNIVALKNKLGVLKDAKPEELEVKKTVISPENAKGIQDAVSAQLQTLIQNESKIAIKTWGADKISDLLQLITASETPKGTENAALVVRTFVNDNKKDLGALKNFPDDALKNPLVFKDPKSFYVLAKNHSLTLVQQISKETENAIAGLKLTEEKQAIALANLAMAGGTDNIAQTLFEKKDQLGDYLKHIPAADYLKIFGTNRIDTLGQRARETIQNEIEKTVTDKINKLTLPDDKEVLDALADAADTGPIRKAVADYKRELGLGHLEDQNIGQRGPIIPKNHPMLDKFKKLAIAQRTAATPDGKIVVDAIAKLQTKLDTNYSSSLIYKNLGNTLLNNADAMGALTTLVGNIKGTDEVRATAFADMLQRCVREAKTNPDMLKTDFASYVKPDASDANSIAAIDTIAKAIAAANKAESDALEIKGIYTGLEQTAKKIAEMSKEAKELADKAGTAAAADSSKETEAKAAIKAHDNLIAREKTVSDALAEVEKELKSIAPAAGPGTAAATPPADALARAKATFDAHKDAETAAKAELDKAKAAYTATQPKATEPGLLGISDAVARAARGQDANSNAIWELNSCKRLKELYTGLYFLKHAAENFGNANAFERLDSAIKSIATLTARIDELKKSKHPGAGGGAPMSAETQTQLEIMKAEFQALQAEMIRIRDTRKALPRESVDRMIQIFGRNHEQFTPEETNRIQTDSTGFAAWSHAMKGYAITNHARPAARLCFGDPHSPQLVQQQGYTTDTWRVYPPDPAKVKSGDMIYFEHEYKPAGATESNFEIVVMDLPQSVSDKGLFIQFLLEINGTPAAQLAPGTPIHDLVFKNIPPVLATDAPPVIDEKTAYKLLQSGEIGTGWSRDTTLAKKFVAYLHEHQNELLPLYGNYQPLVGAGGTITREVYLAKTEEERKNYAPHGQSNLISMPNAVFFEQAAKILSVLVARGYSPMTITDGESQPLLVAMDCLAQKYGIRDTLNFPNSYRRPATLEQVEITRVMNYKIPALDVVDKTLAATAAAATAGHAADIGTYISKPRGP